MPKKFRGTTNHQQIQQHRQAIGIQHKKLTDAKIDPYDRLVDGLTRGVNFATNGNRKAATVIFILLAIDFIHNTQISSAANAQPRSAERPNKIDSTVVSALSRYGVAGMAIASSTAKAPVQRLALFSASMLAGQFFPVAEAKLNPAYSKAVEGAKKQQEKIDEAAEKLLQAPRNMALHQQNVYVPQQQQSGQIVQQQNIILNILQKNILNFLMI